MELVVLKIKYYKDWYVKVDVIIIFIKTITYYAKVNKYIYKLIRLLYWMFTMLWKLI
jgi:hypothetical protein